MELSQLVSRLPWFAEDETKPHAMMVMTSRHTVPPTVWAAAILDCRSVDVSAESHVKTQQNCPQMLQLISMGSQHATRFSNLHLPQRF